jgi:hypothetical protein
MGRHVPEDMPQGEGGASRVVGAVFRLETQGMPSGTRLPQCKHFKKFFNTVLPSMYGHTVHKTEVQNRSYIKALEAHFAW